MKLTFKKAQLVCGLVATAMVCGSALNVQASGKTTDPLGAPSTGGGGGGGTGGGSGGGGGGGGKTTTTSPAPAPQPIVSAPLTFVSVPDASGNVPVCTGSYRIDPYYTTLSLLTVSVQCQSLNLPDGTPLYVTVNVVGYAYPATSNLMLVTTNTSSLTLSGYITPGSTIQSVSITDALGDVIALGQ
jgi:hypothetical protein